MRAERTTMSRFEMISTSSKEGARSGRGTRAPMPNFIVIGAARSGTTSLWNYLRQHPQVYMSPVKHTRFFALEGEEPGFRGPGPRDVRTPWVRNARKPQAITSIEAYRALFDGVTDETAIGEASHSYLYSPKAPERIRRHVPDAKLIAVLRDPSERAHSHFWNLVQTGREPLTDFAQALREEPARIRDCWWPDFYYAQLGFYYSQLKRYFDLFERSRIRVYLYEDLSADPLAVLQDIFRFLDVDDTFVPDVTLKYNVSGLAKSKVLHRALLQLSLARPFVEPLLPEVKRRRVLRAAAHLKGRNLAKPELSPDVRSRLVEGYREDVLKLQDLIGRDLSAWLCGANKGMELH